jgi:cell division protein FtsL
MNKGMNKEMSRVPGESMRQFAALVLLVVVVMASAIGSVYAKHEARKLFTDLQSLHIERDRMEVEWGQLQIEQSTWSTYARVEQLAREDMKMRPPTADEMMLLAH